MHRNVCANSTATFATFIIGKRYNSSDWYSIGAFSFTHTHTHRPSASHSWVWNAATATLHITSIKQKLQLHCAGPYRNTSPLHRWNYETVYARLSIDYGIAWMTNCMWNVSWNVSVTSLGRCKMSRSSKLCNFINGRCHRHRRTLVNDRQLPFP